MIALKDTIECSHFLSGHKQPITCLSINPSETYLASSSEV